MLLAFVCKICDPLLFRLLRLADLLEHASLEVVVSIIQRACKLVKRGCATGAVEAGDVGICDEIGRGVGYKMRDQCEADCCIGCVAY